MKLRDYQDDAASFVENTKLGQVILPTGTGKSVIQGEVIARRIIKLNRFGIYVILTPRILLTNQLMKDVATYLTENYNIVISALTVHSGNPAELYEEDDDEDSKSVFAAMENNATTNTDYIVLRIKQCKIEKKPLFICCTYNSIPTLIRALEKTKVKVEQVLCDEAHSIIEKEFNDNVAKLKKFSKRIHFFTATQKITGNEHGNGMDNEKFYGSVIFRRTPREMIDAGFMIRPRLHWEKAPEETTWSQMVSQAFETHQKKLKKGYNAKILVCCDGSKTVLDLINDWNFYNWRNTKYGNFDVESQQTDDPVTLFSIASHEDIQCQIDGVKVTRNEFLKRLKNHKGKAIVLHINILTEGIDVPDFSGVMFIRNMGLSRFLQSVGRATRRHIKDVGKEVLKFKKWFKPYAWVIVAERGDSDKTANLTTIVHNMRQAGFEPMEEVVIAFDRGTGDNAEFDMTNVTEEDRKSTFGKLFDIEHKIEMEKIAALPTFEERLNNMEF